MKTLATCIVSLACIAGTVPAAAQPAVSAGRYHNLGLAADGGVFWWGSDQGVQQELGQRVAATFPQRVPGLPPAVAVAAGWLHSSAIARDGSVYEWGFSPYRMRQVYLLQPSLGPCEVALVLSGGHGKNPCRDAGVARAARMRVEQPIRIPGVPPAVAIAAADGRTAVISRSGEVYCWDQSTFPKKIAGLERIKAIALGQFHGVALREDGQVFGWGGASGGGIAYQAKQSATLCGDLHPQPFFSGAVAIAAFADSTYALGADGIVRAWGSGWGRDSSMPKEPNPDNKPDPLVGRRIATVDGGIALGGGRDPAALTRDGRVLGWQRDYRPGPGVRPLPGVDNIAVLSSYSSVLALRPDGFVCTRGDNMYGATLPGDEVPEVDGFVPVPLGGGKGVLNLVDAGRAVPADLCAARPRDGAR